jgi:parvulin-like peptidyl-prolyl isomerase
MKRSSLLVLALTVSTIAACSGLSDALTAHVDVVAKAGSQELSVTRLANLLGNAKLQVPINKDVATLVARDLWVPYQLLGMAAAHGDSLTDLKAIDAAAGAMLENAKLKKFMESVSAILPADTGSEAGNLSAKGGLYAARHILFMVPQGASPAVKDSVRKKAQSVLAQVTPANFGEMANRYSEDPGNRQAKNGGDLGVFPRAAMVKPFSDALAALKPGEISQLVESQFGYHIIQRSTWDQAKAKYLEQAGGHSRQVAESLYITQAQAAANAQVKADAPAVVKALAKDPLGHRNDKTVLATYNGGELTAGKLAMFLLANPRSAQLAQQIQTVPDSVLKQFVMNQTQRELLLRRADSAKVGLTDQELADLHRDFAQVVSVSWQSIGIDPKSLADSAKTPAERERLAAARVESFLDRVMGAQAQPVPIPPPLQIILLNKYDAKVNPAGIDRAVERATKIRAAADSVHAAQQPQSAVPLPGAPGAQPGSTPAPTRRPTAKP